MTALRWTMALAALVVLWGSALRAEDEPPPAAVAATAPADASRPLDVVLALDDSGSMRRSDPKSLMVAAVRGFADALPPDARLGIVLFQDRAELMLGLTPHDGDGFAQAVDAAARRITYRGKHTDLPAGVERALYELGANGRPQADRVVVVLTDGIVDVGSEARNLDRATWLRDTLAPAAHERGVRIFGVAFTEAADFELLQSLARTTGGRYFRTLAADEIRGVFAQVRGHLDEIQRAEAEVARLAERQEAEAAQREEEAARAKADAARRDEEARAATAAAAAALTAAAADPPVVVKKHETRTKVVQTPVPVPTPYPVPVPEPVVDWKVVALVALAAVIVGAVSVVALRDRAGSDDAAGMPAARLRSLGTGRAKRYKIRKPVTRIGRARDNDIVLRDETISAHHAVLEWHDGAFHLKDLGSRNGTQRNGVAFNDRDRREMRAVRLRHRDRVAFDKLGFEFLLDGAERVEETQLAGAGILPGGTVISFDEARAARDESAAPAVSSPAAAEPTDELAPTIAKSGKCLVHVAWDATETCTECSRAWCPSCITEKNGRRMCRGCAEKAA